MKSYLGTITVPGITPVECTVLLFEQEIRIGYYGDDTIHHTLQWPINEVEAQFDRSSQSTRIINPQFKQYTIHVEGSDGLDYIQAMQLENRKPWHRKVNGREWGRNAAIFFGIIGGLVLLYFLIVPWLAESMASRVSVKTEEQFGNAVYDALIADMPVDAQATAQVNQFFDAMHVRTAYDIRISVVNGATVNAFALPGGRIVVYTALLDKIESYPELAALLSHEFTHVNNKHSTKSIFRQLGSKVFIGLLLGKFGSVTSILVDHADNLKSLKYSRSLEKEADLGGLQLLRDREIDPAGYRQLFEHLRASTPGSDVPTILASHPDIQDRIEYINNMATGSVVNTDSTLHAIFQKLKQTIK